jgi:tetratricopeptide (TPR) repeat protein
MDEMLSQMTHSVLHLDDVDRIALHGEGLWRPLRRALGVTAFGINAYTAEEAGAPLIERHDETSFGAGGHEELYLVMRGRARFDVGGEELDAPAGTLVLVQPGTERAADAAEADTTVLVIGGRPGSMLPVSPYEHWYAAQPYYDSGDYARAVEVASQGLADWPDHPSLHYQLACYEALGGNREQAIEHLKIAYANNPETREWAAGDEDLDSIRDDPALRS